VWGHLRRGKRGAEPSRFCASLRYNVSGVPPTSQTAPGNAKAPVEIRSPSPGAFHCSRQEHTRAARE
jgi:hypothetical protein